MRGVISGELVTKKNNREPNFYAWTFDLTIDFYYYLMITYLTIIFCYLRGDRTFSFLSMEIIFMLELQDSTYWMALAHLLKWETEKVNRLVIDILHKKNLSFSEFFQLNRDALIKEFHLKPEELRDLIRVKAEMPNLSFLLEDLYAQGFEIIKLNSPEYPGILKDSLKIKCSPPLLYTKGNKQLLQIPSIGIVGARNSSKVSLRFAELIGKKCIENNLAVVIGSAKNIDRVVLDTIIKHHGHSIVVLPQGITTFDFQEYYPQIVSGNILFISMYSPKDKWSNDNATNRNILIYGLTQGVYITQANLSGGTWSGAIFGLGIGRKVYVREARPDEKNANNLLLLKGAISVDSDGNGFQLAKVDKKPLAVESREEKRIPVSEPYKKQITKVDRQIEEGKLNDIFHIDSFYDRQWEVVVKLLNGERILLVEKTGFGKSLCYQYTATQFPGMTVVFSPLIALMRDQISYLKSLGIPSECINSEQTPEENRKIMQDAQEGKIKILYIAPERQESQEWIDAVQKMNLSMVVVDEAHCISTWGHDFRPAFRRVVNLVHLLPENFPVIATTATATQRVAKDVSEQIGGNISVLRGNLLRENFYLRVVKVEDENEKMIWLGEFLQTQEGNGLIYTGTRTNTNIYADWLKYIGVSATNYNAGFDAESRKEIEQGLKSNRWKCIVSTNALGMGIDKPDIRFIVHTQIPASPIHYYQEIGRAGRDGLPTEIVLLYNPADKELPEVFIESCRPAAKNYWKVIEILIKGPLGQFDLMRLSNLNNSQMRTILTDLMEQGIIKESMQGRSKKYEYQFDAPSLNVESFQALRLFKFEELDKIITYTES
ncbi:RecQ family ATP-dependent DNA helicase, partial [Candidatus Poribacteria bacterium]|nr:RecQ family ATP-dependent DNA helicase [Candidatus Poribacteria bacterium]